MDAHDTVTQAEVYPSPTVDPVPPPPLPPAPPGYMTKGEAAAHINKSEATLDRWHRQRVGPPRTKLGSSTLYRKAALDAWMLAQEQASLRTGR